MKIKAGTFCPLVNGECRKLECVWFTQIAGSHPQTGEEFDEWGCAVAWMPLLSIENTKRLNEVGAAIESFRNVTVDTLSPVVPVAQQFKPLPIK
tara:strand:- start:1107 stop:1388 length:282 start_codon:yes stop_codon:yes gene_type:complete